MSFHIGRRVIIHQEESDHLSNDSNRGGGEGGRGRERKSSTINYDAAIAHEMSRHPE